MKIVIVVALVALFQGCQSTTVDDVATSASNVLTTYDQVAEKLKTVVDSMETGAQELIDVWLAGVAPSACVVTLQEELKVVSDKASQNAYKCIHPYVVAADAFIKATIVSLRTGYEGLLGFVLNLVNNIAACLKNLVYAAVNLRSLSTVVLDYIADIIGSLHGVLLSEVTCSNAAVVAASKDIIAILKEVKAC